jgi:hypothetical protein
MKTARILSIALLVLIGGAAMAGGASLVLVPSGNGIGLPLNLLEGTLFENYLIPGLVLFFGIGVCSIVTALLVVLRSSYATRLTVLQGAIICCWIVVQVVIINTLNPIQIAVGAIGFTVFFLGLLQQEEESMANRNNYAD